MLRGVRDFSTRPPCGRTSRHGLHACHALGNEFYSMQLRVEGGILAASGSFQHECHRTACGSRRPSNRQIGAVARALSRLCMHVLGSRFTHPKLLMCLPGVSMLVSSLIYRQASVLPRAWRSRPESFDFTSAIMDCERKACADQPCRSAARY